MSPSIFVFFCKGFLHLLCSLGLVLVLGSALFAKKERIHRYRIASRQSVMTSKQYGAKTGHHQAIARLLSIVRVSRLMFGLQPSRSQSAPTTSSPIYLTYAPTFRPTTIQGMTYIILDATLYREGGRRKSKSKWSVTKPSMCSDLSKHIVSAQQGLLGRQLAVGIVVIIIKLTKHSTLVHIINDARNMKPISSLSLFIDFTHFTTVRDTIRLLYDHAAYANR